MEPKIVSISIVFLTALKVLSVRCEYVIDLNGVTIEDSKPYEKILKYGMLQILADYYEDERRSTQEEVNFCAHDVAMWKYSLTRDSWPWEMADANGKFPHGIFKGNFYSLGQFDQCLAIDFPLANRGRSIKGKYCPVGVGLANITMLLGGLVFNQSSPSFGVIEAYSSLSFTMGACFPHSCTTDQLGNAIQATLIKWNVTDPLFHGNEDHCSVNEPDEWSGLEIAGLVIFSIFAVVMVLSTIIDIFARHFTKRKIFGHPLLISFSLYTNTEKLVKLNKSSNALRCIHGIRGMSMFWVMLGHRYGNMFGFPMLNVMDTLKWRESYSSMIIIASSISVDSFFLMSGLLLSYLFCCQLEKKKSFNVALFYLHRFIRLWPAMAALVLFVVTVMPHMVKAPMWPMKVHGETDKCYEYWWSTLLYVHNYVNPSKTCVGHTWYLAVDTQLYALSPILLIPLAKNKKIGFYNIIFWVVASQVTIIAIVYSNAWGAILPNTPGYWDEYYSTTHIRAAVWMLGFLGGYIIYETRNIQFRMNKILVGFLWILSFCVLWSIVFGIYDMAQVTHKPNNLEDGTYNAFARTGWALSLFWIIFACLKGYGGPVNWLLSLRVWELLGRISFSLYLIHRNLQYMQLGNMRVVPYFSDFAVIYLFFGDIIFSIVVAYFWVMAFESPFLAIEKALLHPRRKTTPLNIHKNNEKVSDGIESSVPEKNV